MGLFGPSTTEAPVECRNGSITKGDRVQTQWEREEGGNDKWFCGVVVEAYTNGKVKLKYDDGDDWTGKAIYVLKLGPEHPGFRSKCPSGFATANPTPQQMVAAGCMPPTQMGAAMPQQGFAQQQPMTTMLVNVPQGVMPGQPFSVVANGQQMMVNCPPGAAPGQQIQVQVPAPMPVAQPMGVPQVVVGQPMVAQAQPVQAAGAPVAMGQVLR
jgi:hypothetical protein